ncbi:chorismate mutase [Falsiroseomonas oryzae]|uniref:chorismate mutase n=1 Tax=Falsiroseomonas oryzae TaxID=2766473 RepID=UPI0022EA51BB|nr:chorismate mutase [Roseomonas sp. MO-31]
MPETADLVTDQSEPGADLAALRAEIDSLDDQLHDLLMRRVDVVARLAASRTKGNGPAIRPGREAVILRRLLGRHAGPLPRAALVRLWRELLAATTNLQAPLTVAAWLPEAGVEVLRGHLGLSAPVTRCADDVAALAAFEAGKVGLVALPAGGRWWRTHYPSRLFVTARLPFLGGEPTVFLLSPTPPDPSGDDLSLLRCPERALAGLPGEGLPPRPLLREGELCLVEVPGIVTAGDVRLAAMGATVLGSYATPAA